MRDPALTLLRVELDRVEYRRGQPVAARARTLHADYTPGGEPGRAGAVRGRTSDGGKPLQHAVEVTTNKDGEAHLELPGLAAGAYRLVGRATIDGRNLTEEQTFVIRPEGRELEDVISQREVLREIAEVTGGQLHRGGHRHAGGAQAARDPGRQPAHGRALVQPAAAAAGDRAAGHRVDLRRRAGHG